MPSIDKLKGNFAKFDPGLFIYFRPFGGLEIIYVRPVAGPEST